MGGESAAYALWFGLTGKVELREEDPERRQRLERTLVRAATATLRSFRRMWIRRSSGSALMQSWPLLAAATQCFGRLHGGEIWGLGVGVRRLGGVSNRVQTLETGVDLGDRVCDTR